MIYDLSDLIDDRNRQLYESISAQIPVELVEADDGYWGAITRDGIGRISCGLSQYPISCFTHELLHIQFDLEGKQRPGYQHEAIDEQEWQRIDGIVEELLPYAYNHLMHHKMFPRFLALGFPASEFLREPDGNERKRVEEDVKRLRLRKKDFPHGLPVMLYVYQFFWATSPNDTSDESAAMLKELRNSSNGTFYGLSNFLKAWNSDPDPDVRRYLAHLFYLCDIPDIGFGPTEYDQLWARDVKQL